MVKAAQAQQEQKQPQRGKGRADPVDGHVGQRMRMRRMLIGMSQEKLGEALGLTFQQIQKYERGANRMGASRIYRLAQVLNVPISYFFADVPEDLARAGQARNLGFAESSQEALQTGTDADTNMFSRRETLELVRTYYRIADPKQRRKIYELIKAIAAGEETAASA